MMRKMMLSFILRSTASAYLFAVPIWVLLGNEASGHAARFYSAATVIEWFGNRHTTNERVGRRRHVAQQELDAIGAEVAIAALFRNLSYCQDLKALRQLVFKVNTRECECLAFGFDLASLGGSNLSDELHSSILSKFPD
jgi:hypothetical protein